MCCLLQVLVVEAAIRAVTMEDRLVSMRIGRDDGTFTALLVSSHNALVVGESSCFISH